MTLPKRRFWNRPRATKSRLHTEQVLAGLSRDVAAPDLTHSIMGRLGYMRVSPRVARRHRVRRWASRVSVLMTAAIALGIGVQFYLSSPEVRRPVGPTISDALREDLSRQQNRIGNMIQTIRQLSPVADPVSEPPPQPSEHEDGVEDASESWIAPVRWV